MPRIWKNLEVTMRVMTVKQRTHSTLVWPSKTRTLDPFGILKSPAHAGGKALNTSRKVERGSHIFAVLAINA